MQEADIFLHPSVVADNGDSEWGSPTVILEVQAMGMPVLSTHHPDVPSVTLPGKSAILVKEREVQGLSNALLQLFDHPEKWGRMGRAACAHISKNITISNKVIRSDLISDI